MASSGIDIDSSDPVASNGFPPDNDERFLGKFKYLIFV